jgi:BlaI family penicillinase repressor
MAFRTRDITETELALLRLLWDHGTATIRELTDAMYPDGTHAQYATVQSLLDRLDQKGCVSRRKRGRVNVYAAKVSRAELIARRLRATADALCDGSLAPLLTHLVRSVDATDEEVEALEGLVERLGGGAAAHDPERR